MSGSAPAGNTQTLIDANLALGDNSSGARQGMNVQEQQMLYYKVLAWELLREMEVFQDLVLLLQEITLSTRNFTF